MIRPPLFLRQEQNTFIVPTSGTNNVLCSCNKNGIRKIRTPGVITLLFVMLLLETSLHHIQRW